MYVMMTLRGKDTNVGEIVGKYKTEENERIIKSYYTVSVHHFILDSYKDFQRICWS